MQWVLLVYLTKREKGYITADLFLDFVNFAILEAIALLLIR